MCGIALIVGPDPDPAAFGRMMDAIAPRGDVRETLGDDRHLLGTQRLKIIDRERAVQPWQSADGRWAVCYNAEVYNFKELRADLAARGHELRSDSDTEVVLEAFLEWGDQAVHQLRGEFAFAVADRSGAGLSLPRDPLGFKPLYWSRQHGQLYVASELNALVPVGGQISEVPPGHAGWGAACPAATLSAHVELVTIGDGDEPITDPAEATRLVRAAVEDSIRVRLDTDLTVGG